MSLVEVTLTRSAPCSWGFRLTGGLDFERALVVASVVDGSPSQASGLKAGDVIVAICGQEAGLMSHKKAQDAVVQAGDNVELVVQRAGGEVQAGPGAWRPQVEVVGGPATTKADPGVTYTKTSLAMPQGLEDTHWDVKHNQTAKGFGGGAAPSAPIQSVAAPTGGPPPGGAPAFRSVAAPVSKPLGPGESRPTGPPQPQVCWACKQPVTGVFLQIKGRPLHADCFVCATCSSSLKNVGHFVIGERLYCQEHVREAQAQLQAGIQGPPPGLAANLANAAPSRPSGPPPGLAANLANVAPSRPSGPPPGLAANLANVAPSRPSGPPPGLAANLAKLSIRPQGPGTPQGPPVGAPAPGGPPGGQAAWEDKLNANVAGRADNAEDFTKQFMADLMGGQ